MKNTIRFFSTLTFLFFIAGIDCSLQSQTLIIDNFNKEPVNFGKKYPSYVNTQEGYDIYYVDGNVQVSRVPIDSNNTKDKILRVNFTIPPQEWLSIKREFHSPINLSDYKGLIFNLLVDSPSPSTVLRVTISDLTNNKKQGDEMWWGDCDKKLLVDETAGWIQVKVPFNKFKISWGAGTRQNDYKLNLRKIISYEINLLSESANKQKGEIYLDYIRAYK